MSCGLLSRKKKGNAWKNCVHLGVRCKDRISADLSFRSRESLQKRDVAGVAFSWGGGGLNDSEAPRVGLPGKFVGGRGTK